jgi:hypothetical protein
VQPGEEHKRERVNVCTKAKRRWNRRRAHEAGAGKGGFRLIVVCCFNGLEATSRTNAIRQRAALGSEHQQSTKIQAVPAEPTSAAGSRAESTPQAQRGHKSFPWSQNTKLRPSFTLAQSIRGRPSRAITPQPTLISRRSSAPQPLIRSSSHFKHESCHS